MTDHALTVLRTGEALAVDALQAWSGTPRDLLILECAATTALELCRRGADEWQTVARATSVLRRCATMKPHSIGVSRDDLGGLRRMLAMVDRQRGADRAVTTRATPGGWKSPPSPVE